MALVGVPDTLLSDALADIAADVDAAFDAMLPIPDDARARLVEVPGVGHAPTMDEAEARAAIDAWIAELPKA